MRPEIQELLARMEKGSIEYSSPEAPKKPKSKLDHLIFNRGKELEKTMTDATPAIKKKMQQILQVLAELDDYAGFPIDKTRTRLDRDLPAAKKQIGEMTKEMRKLLKSMGDFSTAVLKDADDFYKRDKLPSRLQGEYQPEKVFKKGL